MVSQIMEIVEGSNIIIQSAFNDYYGDKIFFVATVVCFVYLFVTCKELRYKFLLPIALILFVIINPIVYHYILSRVVYRRIFWMIPNAAIMGAAFVFFLKRQKKVWLKWCVLALITLFIFRYGNNVFQSEVFTRVQNWEKLNEATIFVCDLMKEIDDEPRAIVTQQLFIVT